MSNKKQAKEIFGIKAPAEECGDKKCPFHGTLNVKKKSFTGVVVSAKMHNTVAVEWSRRVYIPKYERYLNKRTKILVHNPECIDTKEGDIVKIFRTRPLSKLVNFVVVENLGSEKNFLLKKEAQEEAKVQQKPSKESVEETEDESKEEVKEEVAEAESEESVESDSDDKNESA
ncbi:30S ribosomal protein S17 [Candidatus Woesearchaeota archaeon]|nr:30S ribosomal protein S17 [Candidatus Woesearchaeota archaeon]